MLSETEQGNSHSQSICSSPYLLIFLVIFLGPVLVPKPNLSKRKCMVMQEVSSTSDDVPGPCL